MIVRKNTRIMITGARGFLGNHVVNSFKAKNYSNLVTLSSKDFDLRKENQVRKLFRVYPDVEVVVHLAGDVGGIQYSRSHPAKQFYNNLLINTFMLHYSSINKVEKFVGIGSVCEYPATATIPYREDEIWNGYPVASNDAYGLSKRAMLAQSISYNREFGFNAIHLLINNLYGPGDNFLETQAHVIPSLIMRFHNAMINEEKRVVVWGKENVSREFVYVNDIADSIVKATVKYNKVEPLNIGSASETTIKDVSMLIAKIVGFEGEIIFDDSKPSGQSRRKMDGTMAKKELNLSFRTKLNDGLKKTYSYYLNLLRK